MEFFDTHAHYDDSKFDEDREEVIQKIYNSGVTRCANVGCNIETTEMSIELSKKYEFIYAICGIHPSEVPQEEEQLWKEIEKIKELIKKAQKVVAVGEIGLDYYWDDSNKEMQKKAFIAQIELANELNLPIAIHTRDAIDDTIQIINSYKVNKYGIVHCCPFNRELVKNSLKQGYYIAFGGTCTFKNAKNADEIIQMVPNDRILLETDTPYLSPEPFRGTRNDSSNLRFVVEKIAKVKGMEPEKVAQMTYQNANKIFGLN